jgi:hypothetical protein
MLKSMVAAVLFAIPGAACATTAGLPAMPQAGSGYVEVTIVNETARALRIFALDSGAELSLGRVDPLAAAIVRIPRQTSSALRLVARSSVEVSTSIQHTSEAFTVSPNQRITWRLRPSPFSAVPNVSRIEVTSCEMVC